jgi:hypothetical protein
MKDQISSAISPSQGLLIDHTCNEQWKPIAIGQFSQARLVWTVPAKDVDESTRTEPYTSECLDAAVHSLFRNQFARRHDDRVIGVQTEPVSKCGGISLILNEEPGVEAIGDPE